MAKSFIKKLEDIKKGKNLNKYLYDKDVDVRMELVAIGYGLEILAHDKD